MHHDEPALAHERERMRVCGVETVTVEHDFGTVTARARHFDLGCESWHHDHRRNRKPVRVVGNTLRMIAGRRGDYTGFTLAIAQCEQSRQRSAFLECRGELQVLELEVDLRTGELRQRSRVQARRIDDGALESGRRVTNVGERYAHVSAF